MMMEKQASQPPLPKGKSAPQPLPPPPQETNQATVPSPDGSYGDPAPTAPVGKPAKPSTKTKTTAARAANADPAHLAEPPRRFFLVISPAACLGQVATVQAFDTYDLCVAAWDAAEIRLKGTTSYCFAFDGHRMLNTGVQQERAVRMHDGAPWNKKTMQKARVNLSGLVPQGWQCERLEEVPDEGEPPTPSTG